MWAEPVRGAKPDKYREDLIAAGHSCIKAFTLIEIEIACKVSYPMSNQDPQICF